MGLEQQILSSLEAGDLVGLRRHLKDFESSWSDLDFEEADAIIEQVPRILDFLLQEGSLEEVLALQERGPFDRAAIYAALDRRADRLSVDDLLGAASELTPPSQGDAPAIYRVLTENADERISSWFDTWIRERAGREKEEGRSFHVHLKTVSTFQTVRWLPDDQGLSSALVILGERPDRRARLLLHDYLRELPWGQDRMPTAALLEQLATGPSPQDLSALRQVLEDTPPGVLRLNLMGALARHQRPEMLRAALSDLAGTMDESLREDYLHWLREQLSLVEDRASLEGLKQDMEAVPTSGWSLLMRGYAGTVGRHKIPGFAPAAVSSLSSRLLISLISGFEAVRLDHTGCMISLPLLGGSALASMYLLDWTVGPPPESLRLADEGAMLLWIATLGLTASTHFSGHETLRQKLLLALGFWAVTVFFLAVTVAIRLVA